MYKAVLASGPRRGFPMKHFVAIACEWAVKVCATGSGRTALDEVRLPPGIQPSQLSPRARRLMREAQISPW
jgi:hypothetical protein